MFKRIRTHRLLERLAGPNPGASEAAEALAKMGDRSIIPTLLDNLDADSTSRVAGNQVWLSIKLLGDLGDRTTPRAILNRMRPLASLYPPLNEAFDRLHASPEEWIELLGAVAEDTSYRGGSYDETYRVQAIERLEQFGSRGASVLAALAGDRIRPGTGDPSDRVRKAARKVMARLPGATAHALPRGTYTDEEIKFIIDSLTAWWVARHDNRYSPRLYDRSQVFIPMLTVQNIREHLNSSGIAKAIALVATSQWIAHSADDPEASIARTFVYEPYLQGEAAALVDEREAE